MRAALAGIVVLCATVSPAHAQTGTSVPASHWASLQPSSTDNYWKRFALGFATSILAHETAHILSAVLMGYHPSFGFDNGRPTVYSGIDSQKNPHDQFIFSASGLVTQTAINEAILDIPHDRGGSLERGVLAGGIGTTLFYITIGRNGAVSDIAYMARTSSLSKTQLSLIFGGASAIQALRISKNPKYDHFFVRQTQDGLAVGLTY